MTIASGEVDRERPWPPRRSTLTVRDGELALVETVDLVRRDTAEALPRSPGRTGARPEMPGEDAIRTALRRHCCSRTNGNLVVVPELGLIHARARIDLATIGRHIHGYEIKSPLDSLRRLPRQLDVYRQALQKLTLVVAERHHTTVDRLLPDWCGIFRVRFGPKGGVRFESTRRPAMNPHIDKFKLAHLLWAQEAKDALAKRGLSKRELRAPRQRLYRLLANELSTTELVALIRRSMIKRAVWQGRLSLS